MIAPRSSRHAAKTTKPSSGSSPDRTVRGRREQIVDLLLADILEGEFTAGEHLTTEVLAQRYKVSHTPIREALSTLAGVGLIDLRPNRGAVVRRLAASDLIDLIQVRRVLECEAVRRACGRADPLQFQPLADELRKLAAGGKSRGHRFVDQARQLDSQLHDLIATSSGNALLASELNRLKLLFRAMRDAAWQVEGTPLRRRLLEEAGEHLAIVEAILANDSRAARRAMSRHIRAAIKYWMPIIQAQSSTEPALARGKNSPRTKP